MEFLKKLSTGLTVLATAGLLTSTVHAAPFFSGLGDLPGGGVESLLGSEGMISADGSVVVGRSDSANGREAFRWTQSGGMVGLGDLPGGDFSSAALGASADGAVVVGSGRVVTGPGTTNGQEAFRWTQSGGMVGLGDLAGGGIFSLSRSASADGSVVVGQSLSGNGMEAFRWTQSGGMVGLGDLAGGSFSSFATSTSADGTVAVGRGHSSNGFEAFRWTQSGGMAGLGDLAGGGFFSQGLSISADGTVIVGRGTSANGAEAFRWTQSGGMVGLGDLGGGGFLSQALATSADGSVVVGHGDSSDGKEAFIWDGVNGMRSLDDVLVTDFSFDLTGWTLTQADSISDDGLVIAGTGIHNGVTEAFIADMRQGVVVQTPEPGMLAILGIGLAAIGYARRRRFG